MEKALIITINIILSKAQHSKIIVLILLKILLMDQHLKITESLYHAFCQKHTTDGPAVENHCSYSVKNILLITAFKNKSKL